MEHYVPHSQSLLLFLRQIDSVSRSSHVETGYGFGTTDREARIGWICASVTSP
jgi:hypothetical protein